MDKKRRGILLVMSNANGWRNPKVFGWAEIKTTSIADKIKEVDWYIILPNQLFNVFSKTFTASHFHYLPIKTFFSETNVIKDLLQWLIYTWQCIRLAWTNRDNFDLIYSATTNFSDIFPAKIISFITSKPYIVKYHISIYDEAKISRIYQNFREEKNSILDSLVRAILARTTIIYLKKAKIVLVVCEYLGKQLEACGVAKDKIKLNYNGLDFQEMMTHKDSTIIKKYDICCIGRIEKNKGIQDMVDVVKNLKDKGVILSAVIIGDGSYLPELKNYIKELELEGAILVTGFLWAERYKYLQQSRLFVSPTYAKEGFGLTLLEALFFGTQIIAYTHPVLEEVFNKYGSVRLIPQDRDHLEREIIKPFSGDMTSSSDLDEYSLENCVRRERGILSQMA